MAKAQAAFSSILDRPVVSAEKPKPFPIGTYICAVKGMPRIDKSPKKGTEFSEYTLAILKPLDDVDPDALEEMGGWKGKTIRATYYHTEDSIYRLRKFLGDLGIEEEEDKSFSQAIAQAPGRQVIVTVKHEVSQNGEAVYAVVADTARVE